MSTRTRVPFRKTKSVIQDTRLRKAVTTTKIEIQPSSPGLGWPASPLKVAYQYPDQINVSRVKIQGIRARKSLADRFLGMHNIEPRKMTHRIALDKTVSERSFGASHTNLIALATSDIPDRRAKKKTSTKSSATTTCKLVKANLER